MPDDVAVQTRPAEPVITGDVANAAGVTLQDVPLDLAAE
jgi:hypothetical protein